MNIMVSGLAGLYLYGSRARAEHHPESDADLAVILSKDFDFWREVSVLSDLSYDYLADQNVCIDAIPVALLEWNNPSSHVNRPWSARCGGIARPSEQNLE
jgi:uncharacterized protein